MSCDELTRLTLTNFVPPGTIKVAVEVDPLKGYYLAVCGELQPDRSETHWKDVLIIPPHQTDRTYGDLIRRIGPVFLRPLNYDVLFAIKEQYHLLNIGRILATGNLRKKEGCDGLFEIPMLTELKEVIAVTLDPKLEVAPGTWVIAEQVV